MASTGCMVSPAAKCQNPERCKYLNNPNVSNKIYTEYLILPSARPAVHEVFQTIKNFVTLPPNIEQTGKSPTQGSDRTPSISAEPVSGSVHHSFSCELTFHISLLKNSKLLGPPEDVRREACPFLHSVVQKALTEHGPDDTANSKVRVLLPSGLKLIESDAMWTEAVNEAARLGWMNSLNVLVEL